MAGFVKNVCVVSLSAGTIGESFVKHEADLGVKRLREMGLNVIFGENALKGIDFVKAHPEERAKDLLSALKNPEIDMILCAIGGEDAYRLLPYLFDNGELESAVDEMKKSGKEKIFLGYSDSTMNHFMLHKAGLNTFYGQSFLSDVCEMAPDMLPYTKKYFTELISTGKIKEITPSDVWYENRTDYSPAALGTMPTQHENMGFELLQGEGKFSGEILGGCLDTIFDIFDSTRFADIPVLCKKYELFPKKEDWCGKILLLETSEELMSVEKYEKALGFLKNYGVFDEVSGVIVGKPYNEYLFAEYKQLLKKIVPPSVPVVSNISVGHAYPHCIIPLGVRARVDAYAQRIVF